MAKKIYVIKYLFNHFGTYTVNIIDETQSFYYIESCFGLDFKSRISKSAEGKTWTTDEAKFPEIQQNYVNKIINAQKNNIIAAQDNLTRLIENAKKLGLKVEE